MYIIGLTGPTLVKEWNRIDGGEQKSYNHSSSSLRHPWPPKVLFPWYVLMPLAGEFMTEKFSFAAPEEDIPAILALFAAECVSTVRLPSDVAEAAESIIGSPWALEVTIPGP